MPLAIPPGYAHIAIEHRHQLDPEPWYVTHGCDVGEMGGDVEAIANRASQAYTAAWTSSRSSLITITGVQVTLGTDGGEPIRAFIAATVSLPGGEPAEALPQNCALLVRKQSAIGGRRNRGRCFIPGVLYEANVNAVGLIAPGGMGGLQAAASAWLTNLNSGNGNPDQAMPMVILHSTGLSAIPLPTPVVALTCDNLISTQRRRLR